MKEKYLIHLAIQIYKEFDIHNKHLLIDNYCENINNVYKEFLKHDNKNLSLLDSVNEYIENYKDEIWNMIKNSFE